ncbi:CpaE family protein [Rhodosalinus sp. 5P4]|uniref:AAA family ATPase n=1 Tax=Rhodosalinus sp. 5P4 TaxID=3239196 RepID=UPI0035269005
MSEAPTSILLIGQDDALPITIDRILQPGTAMRVTAQPGTLSSLNGQAHPLASQHDILLCETDPNDPAEISALRQLSQARAPNAILIALTEEDVPLSQARALSRAGADDVMPRSVLETDLAGEVAKWRERRAAQLPALWTGRNTLGKVITVAGARGGVGKTTLAVNLADALQAKSGFRNRRHGASVAILDLDIQFGTVASMLDVDANNGIYRMAIEGNVPDRAYIENCQVRAACGVTVIPAPERFTPLDAVTSEQVAAMLDTLMRTHDYVVVDLPGPLVSWLEPVLAQTDRMLIASDVTVPSIRMCKKLMDFFTAEQPGLAIEVVAALESRPMMLAQHHRAAMKLLDRTFDHWLPLDTRPAREGLDRGKTLFDVAPRSRLAKAVRKLARDIARDLPPRDHASMHAH